MLNLRDFLDCVEKSRKEAAAGAVHMQSALNNSLLEMSMKRQREKEEKEREEEARFVDSVPEESITDGLLAAMNKPLF